MIIKPSPPGQGGPALARYLMEGKNEHAELLELRNMDAPSLQAALFDIDMLARGSQCHAHALHIQMRAAPGEQLSASHWLEAADRVTALFGMEAHQAALVLHHQQDGCTHAHLVLNRVHPETLIAADLWRSKKKCIDLSRELEKEWGLRQLDSQNKHPHRDYSKAGQQETEQARRTGENVHDIREHVRWLWEQSPNGLAFAAALEEGGYQLAKGDRRAYVVLDPHGSPYSLGSRTTGAKAREVREKLGDLDPASVPDIEQARRLLSERQAERKQERERQGKGEARAQSQPTPEPTPEPTPQPKPAPGPAATWWKAASQRAALNTPAPRFYASPRAERRDQWEQAAARRLNQLRNWQALEREQQQRRFTEAAKLERGEAVKAFNTQQRHDLTNLLYKEQAEALAGELQRQQARREQWDKPDRRREPRPRTYPPRGFKSWLVGLFTAKAATPAPTPATARPLADAEPQKTPEESLRERLEEQEEEKQEENRQQKGRARSPSPAEALEKLAQVRKASRTWREKEERRRTQEQERQPGRSIADDLLDGMLHKKDGPR